MVRLGGIKPEEAKHHPDKNIITRAIGAKAAHRKYLEPKGVMVFIEAEHMCMSMRGVQKPGTKTVTSVVRGAFAEDYMLQQTFLQMIRQ